MEQKELKTEWEFITDYEGGTVKLYTVPHITAKLQWQTNKYYQVAFEKQMMLSLSDANFREVLRSGGLALDGSDDISSLRGVITEHIQEDPLEELTKYDLEKAVEFCLLCLDEQRILKQDNGRENLNQILDKENWGMQKPELIQEIINQYSFRADETNTVS